jgi:hypothetical protein
LIAKRIVLQHKAGWDWELPHTKEANGIGKYLHRINDQSRELRIHGMFDNAGRLKLGRNREESSTEQTLENEEVNEKKLCCYSCSMMPRIITLIFHFHSKTKHKIASFFSKNLLNWNFVSQNQTREDKSIQI